MASIYRHRKGWQASVTVKGANQKKNFPSQKEAKQWAAAQEAKLNTEHQPLLGGPTQTTLALALYHYAHKYTIVKKGAKAELDRINRYLDAARMPRLSIQSEDTGQVALREMHTALDEQKLPGAFYMHREQRKSKHQKTDEFRKRLANTKISNLTPATFRDFLTTGLSEGLSGSTMQKEYALLKHLFNMATEEWSWGNFINPLSKVKTPKTGPGRDRLLTANDEANFKNALEQCDSPLMLPLFELAIATTARLGSLLRLEWSHLDLEGRVMVLHDTKAGNNVRVPLSLHAIQILNSLPREIDAKYVFPMTRNSIKCAWNRACERAKLSDFRFHDTRHIGTSRLAKRIPNATALRAFTGHADSAMLDHYTHFSTGEILEWLDATEPEQQASNRQHTHEHATPLTTEEVRRSRKVQRLVREAPTTAVTAPSLSNVIVYDFKNRLRRA